MKTYEIHVSASYVTDGGSLEWNAFTEYVEAPTAAAAKKALRAELKADGYKTVEMSDVFEVR